MRLLEIFFKALIDLPESYMQEILLALISWVTISVLRIFPTINYFFIEKIKKFIPNRNDDVSSWRMDDDLNPYYYKKEIHSQSSSNTISDDNFWGLLIIYLVAILSLGFLIKKYETIVLHSFSIAIDILIFLILWSFFKTSITKHISKSFLRTDVTSIILIAIFKYNFSILPTAINKIHFPINGLDELQIVLYATCAVILTLLELIIPILLILRTFFMFTLRNNHFQTLSKFMLRVTNSVSNIWSTLFLTIALPITTLYLINIKDISEYINNIHIIN